ncbi:MAG: hypothetical protein RBR69_07070 [Candidatus Cloacimonadaceae bacterium]|jgi:hypothetical protein|nr:hypothetical protein [Candidatus Cloacimonadota bacterium]MDD3533383.1 hypothetical protein [Candidatus Cloacimonadota bacterium]MDY0127873.1 hypothetical protein [Candidatus Cloacimonadaceae bacterium]
MKYLFIIATLTLLAVLGWHWLKGSKSKFNLLVITNKPIKETS